MNNPHIPRIILTCGEPAGIGPDLAVGFAQSVITHAQVVVAGSAKVLSERAGQLGLPLRLRPFNTADRGPASAGELILTDIETARPVTAGKLDPANAGHVLQLLDYAADGCQAGEFDALLTGPLHKGVINDAGIAFTGHTEYLARRLDAYPVMMLATDSLRVALATTHLPLSAVPAAITGELLTRVLTILHRDLQVKFAIDKPRILVCGLNPHAGESGHLGREEIDIIEPALARLRQQGLDLVGPLPADTLFTPRHLDEADAVLAMYHDQGLPVLKYAGFGKAVNITLGLPIIRTSVDHGTALDLAGSGAADSGSLQAALAMAVRLAESARR